MANVQRFLLINVKLLIIQQVNVFNVKNNMVYIIINVIKLMILLLKIVKKLIINRMFKK